MNRHHQYRLFTTGATLAAIILSLSAAGAQTEAPASQTPPAKTPASQASPKAQTTPKVPVTPAQDTPKAQDSPKAQASPKPKAQSSANPKTKATPKPKANPKAAPVADTSNRLAQFIVLTDGAKATRKTRKQLGFSLTSSSPVRFAVDLAKLKATLGSVAKTFHTDAVDAQPVVMKGKFSVKPGQAERLLNVPATVEHIVQGITANPATIRFPVSVSKKSSVLTAERLKGITGQLAVFSTKASGTEARDTNIALAVDRIDGTLLSPKETFSLNETVGKRTKASGFKEAHVFVDAKVVNGVGGGVSQVTGTLFNAAALAGLTIKEVNPHSRPVAYLPLGRDATVAYGHKDLKFINNTSAPVYIKYTFIKKRLTATLWGKPVPGRKIVLRPKVQRLGAGKINAQLYRVIKLNGKVVAKDKLLSHAYRWTPGAK